LQHRVRWHAHREKRSSHCNLCDLSICRLQLGWLADRALRHLGEPACTHELLRLRAHLRRPRRRGSIDPAQTLAESVASLQIGFAFSIFRSGPQHKNNYYQCTPPPPPRVSNPC
jgi:hypothetical protein